MVRTPVLAGFNGLRDSRSGRYLVDSFVPDYLKSQEVTGLYLQRRLISTFQVAESMGFKGEFRQWEHLLRVGDENCDPFFSFFRQRCPDCSGRREAGTIS
jgi:hypothetical protein